MASNTTRFDDLTSLAQEEPSLEEIFAEPIVQLVMKRDGVRAQDMRCALDRLLLQPA